MSHAPHSLHAVRRTVPSSLLGASILEVGVIMDNYELEYDSDSSAAPRVNYCPPFANEWILRSVVGLLGYINRSSQLVFHREAFSTSAHRYGHDQLYSRRANALNHVYPRSPERRNNIEKRTMNGVQREKERVRMQNPIITLKRTENKNEQNVHNVTRLPLLVSARVHQPGWVHKFCSRNLEKYGARVPTKKAVPFIHPSQLLVEAYFIPIQALA
ncbi:hypothetical protein BJ165DRAFT_1408121 [Panaeolus papilionaceus]|nr:hypothetical protein BJ165DRAFT_1408121 [Panaeolus papilionaceus]